MNATPQDVTQSFRDGKGLIPDNLIGLFKRWGSVRGVDWRILAAIAKVESDFNIWALNPSDPSAGLMGTQPLIVWTFGLDQDRLKFSTELNQSMIDQVRGNADLGIKSGSGFFAELMRKWGHRGLPDVVTMYNIGEPKVLAGITNPPYLHEINGGGVLGWLETYRASF